MHDCSRPWRMFYILTALFIAAGLFGCATSETPVPTKPPAQAAVPAERKAAPEPAPSPVYQDHTRVTYFPAPGRIDLCGEPVPLDQQDVMERFDKEFTLVVYNHAQVYRWLKRKDRYFPMIEERLRRLNLPEDLKYVALVESEPPLNAPEKRKPPEVRYDFATSPDAALQYLGELYRGFKSWSLAVAAFRYGEKRIIEESGAQGVRNYYQIMLPQETERYVFRILAVKAVLSDPTRYGYELPR